MSKSLVEPRGFAQKRRLDPSSCTQEWNGPRQVGVQTPFLGKAHPRHATRSGAWILSAVLPLCAFVSVAFLLGESFVQAQGKKGKDKKEKSEVEEQVFEVDPEGQPKGYDGEPGGPTYYLWRTGDQWHLRSKTGKKKHTFSGTIALEGGRVTKIFNFEGLEGEKKKGGGPDAGRLNDARNRIDFRFVTVGREDGFDFMVSKETTAIVFDLKVDGFQHRGPIRIGFDGRSPAQPVFKIPVPPVKEDAKKSGAEKADAADKK